ncbi:MAG: EAL domain-containing protein [Burkholderiales bacterium]
MVDAVPRPATPQKVLIVDDIAQNIDVLSATLADLGHELIVATAGARALELAVSQQPDLMLLDVMMPGMDGFEVCRRLKANPATADLPVIFVTARTEDVALGFAAGGADYIGKPIQPDEVRARVRHQLERRELLAECQQLNQALEEKVRERTAELTVANRQLRLEVNERRYMQDRLNYLATHDFVTRLYNRNALDAHVSDLLARVQTDGTKAVFVLVDIDQFRLINESCGCIAGDELLREFGDTVAGVLARSDFFARLGGDKFAIVSEASAADKGLGLAGQILQQIAAFEFRWDERSFKLAATIALVPVTDAVVSFDQLMLMGDEAAYLGKREGRGTIRVYEADTTHNQAHRDTINWAFVLLDALQHNHFRAFFQRLQPLPGADAKVRGEGLRVETLVRLWDAQRQTLVLPGHFIPPAERFHLVSEVDRWMLREVIGLLGRERELHDILSHVTINLSALSIREPGLADYVIEQLRSHGVPPRLLCFEITETEAIVNLQSAREFMQTLRTLGCHFSLDDFGSGFASFSYLRELPFDTLKIDGVFVRDMDSDETHAAMVRSMCEMAQLLGKPVVAEFVETAAVAELLGELGVSWGQGYLFHRPELLSAAALRHQAAEARARLKARSSDAVVVQS